MLKDVNEIISKINENSKDAYLVGGAVRDMVLNRPAHDYDIATNMSYEQLETVFPKNFPSGKAFGIITIFYNDSEYEIAHFRNDGDYFDSRHCDVELVETIEEDLKRRDFTINAMAWSEKSGIIDPYGGTHDIENKLIKAVGNADDRFIEDPLRMLRAIRFSAQLGFDIESKTYEAIKRNAHLIKNISAERIEAELTKILTSENPEKIELLYNTTITKYILPEFDAMMECEQNNPNHIYNVGQHTLVALKNATINDKNLMWAILLHDIAKPLTKENKDGVDHFPNHADAGSTMADKILRRLKFSNDDRNEITKLIKMHDTRVKKLSKIRKDVADYGIEFFNSLYLLQRADIMAQSDFNKEEKLEAIDILNQRANQVKNDKTAIAKSDLKINGNDLIELGFSGKEIGAIIQNLYVNCLGQPSLNDKEKLLNMAKSFKKKTLDELIASYDTKYKNNNKTNKEPEKSR